jgi:ABC-2 type transport system permease protein
MSADEARLQPYGVLAIYKFEMARFRRTLWQSLVTPVITTSLYFVVFGAAIGSRMREVDGVPYGAFIVPGLIMLSLFTESLNNASFGIYLPKFTGTIYELLSAPVSALEIVLAYVGAAATKSVILGLVILATASVFVPIASAPGWMIAFLLLTRRASACSVSCSASGQRLRAAPVRSHARRDAAHVPGGAILFDRHAAASVAHVSLFNPVVYLISGFRWSFYAHRTWACRVSLVMALTFFAICLAGVAWIFKTGYRLKS